MSMDQVLEEVQALGLGLVEITGGEPLAQSGCLDLLRKLCDAGYEVLLETSGAFDIGAVDPRVAKIVDVKCPGSAMAERNEWANLDRLGPRDEVKFVLADRADYEWARAVVQHHAAQFAGLPVHFSPVYGRLESSDLGDWILQDRLNVRLHLQLHRAVWPNRTRLV